MKEYREHQDSNLSLWTFRMIVGVEEHYGGVHQEIQQAQQKVSFIE